MQGIIRAPVRIALFDAINERHVGESLERALRARGHEVLATGPVWPGATFPDAEAHRERIAPAVRAMLDHQPDAMVCLRAFALRPRIVDQIRRAGVTTLVWFPDDPVLYRRGYRHVVEAYDVALHCGPEAVLEFYERRHGPTGVNFPFWTDSTAFPPGYDPANAAYDAIFLGNTKGGVRARRYGLLAGLPVRVRLHGQVDDDPAGIAAPFLRQQADVVAALSRARLGISLAQRFADYRGHEYGFPELAALGSFELPSRVAQYAATGLPVVAMDPSGVSEALPETVVARDRDELASELKRLLADRDGLVDLGRRTRERFDRRLSAERRVELLERLLADPEGWRGMSVEERATLWQGDDREPGRATPRRRPVAVAPPGRPTVVVAGYYGAANAGDELILRAITGRLARAGVQPVVASQSARAVARTHGVPAFARVDVSLAEAVVRASSAVVLGGGGLLHDYAFARSGGLAGMFAEPALSVPGWAPLIVLAELLGRPAHLFGLGVGPLEDPDARRLAGWLAGHANSVSVRDRRSRELLKGLAGAPPVVELAPDPVYALELGAEPPPPAIAQLAGRWGLLVVNLRPWAEAEGLAGRAAQAVGAVARRHRLAVIALPMQAGEALDEGALAALLTLLPGDVPRLLLPWTADPAVLAAVLGASAAALTMRLHAALLAHRVGTPCAGLAYDPKIAAHFEEADRPRACLPLDAPAEAIEQALEDALRAPRGRAPVLARLEGDARAGLDRLADRLAALPAPETPLPEAVHTAPSSEYSSR